MFTISDNENDFIGLEDIEKKRGLVEYKVNDLEAPNLQVESIQPKLKEDKQVIIVRDGRNKRNNEKSSKLF